MEKGEQLQKFYELCENSSFPNKENLLEGLRTDELRLKQVSNGEVPSTQMLDIYEVRAKILAKKRNDYSERLRSEILKFVNELENVTDEKVDFWMFSANESLEYVAFEGVNSQKILGCLFFDRNKRMKLDEQN